MNPPFLARILLFAMAGERDAEFLAGDLYEEFLHLSTTQGPRAGRRWYLSQVLRSSLPLWQLRFRRGGIAHVAAAAGLGVALPLLLLDRLWSFVYSLIPLKEDLHRAPIFLAINTIFVCLLAAFCGATAGTLRRAAAIAAATSAAALFGVWGSASLVPIAYVWLLLLAAPAAALASFRCQRRLP